MISDRCIFCFESQVQVGVCLSCGAFSPVAPELFECLGLPSLRIEKLDGGNIDLQQTCLAACAFADPASWGGFIAFPRKVMLRACLASFIRASFLTEADWGGQEFLFFFQKINQNSLGACVSKCGESLLFLAFESVVENSVRLEILFASRSRGFGLPMP